MKMRKFLLALAVVFSYLTTIHATNNIVVSDVVIPSGGTTSISVELNNDKAYTAFTMKLTLPEGITFTSITKSSRMQESHSLTSQASTGMIGCLSAGNEIFTGTSGTLFSINISDDSGLAVGSKIQATLTEVNFSTTSAEETLDNVTFNITIGEPDDGRIHFDENSTTLPTYTAGEKGNVRMARTINAGQWSTIVLPFTLTKAKAEANFGSDVQLAEFSGFDVDYGDDEENVTPLGITIKFTTYTMTAKKSMTGGKPFLIKTSKDITSIEAEDVTLAASVNEVQKTDEYETAGKFTGSLVKTKVPADGLFISDNNFYYSVGKTNIKAFRGWFELGAVLNKETDFGVKMFIDMDGMDTRVEGINANNLEGTIYDLNGRRLERTTHKGIYIVNGKKVVKN